MSIYRLNISLEINDNDTLVDVESWAISRAKDILCDLFDLKVLSIDDSYGSDYFNCKVSLTRDGDRAGLNLLLPRLEGRAGSHLQGRKANLCEVINYEKKE